MLMNRSSSLIEVKYNMKKSAKVLENHNKKSLIIFKYMQKVQAVATRNNLKGIESIGDVNSVFFFELG